MAIKLNKLAKRGLTRLGDIMIPGDGEMPSFSEAGGIHQVDDFIEYAPEEDIKMLDVALAGLAFVPTYGLEKFLFVLENATEIPTELGTPLRQLNLAVRGLVFSCYYNESIGSVGSRPCDLIGYSPNRIID